MQHASRTRETPHWVMILAFAIAGISLVLLAVLTA